MPRDVHLPIKIIVVVGKRDHGRAARIHVHLEEIREIPVRRHSQAGFADVGSMHIMIAGLRLPERRAGVKRVVGERIIHRPVAVVVGAAAAV